jgi:hypothetical protein
VSAEDRYAITLRAQDVRARPHDPDWEVLDAQPLPTTPEVVAALALMLAAPPGMLAAGVGFVLARYPAAASGRSWGLVVLLGTLALIAYATAGMAALGRLRGGAHRRRLLLLASHILSRWSTPEHAEQRLQRAAAAAATMGATGPVVAATGAGVALAGLLAVVLGVVHAVALAGSVPVALLAVMWWYETAEANRRHGARQRVHQRAAAVTTHVLEGMLILAALYTATLAVLARIL